MQFYTENCVHNCVHNSLQYTDRSIQGSIAMSLEVLPPGTFTLFVRDIGPSFLHSFLSPIIRPREISIVLCLNYEGRDHMTCHKVAFYNDLASCPKFYLYKYESVCEQGQLHHRKSKSNILLPPHDQIKIVAMEVLN